MIKKKPSEIQLDLEVNQKNMEAKELFLRDSRQYQQMGRKSGLLGNRSNAMVVQIADEISPSCLHSAMIIFLPVLPFLDPKFSTALTVITPCLIFLKTTGLFSNHSVSISAEQKLRPLLSLLFYHVQDSKWSQIEVLILEYFPADGLAFMGCQITTLTQKSSNNSVKGRTLIAKLSHPRAQRTKVLLSLELCLQIV